MTVDKNKYILSIKGMSKSFGRNKVLKHIDLNVKPGTIMGLMGENGAGKSTMMKCLFGTYQKDEGTIILDGREKGNIKSVPSTWNNCEPDSANEENVCVTAPDV